MGNLCSYTLEIPWEKFDRKVTKLVGNICSYTLEIPLDKFDREVNQIGGKFKLLYLGTNLIGKKVTKSVAKIHAPLLS